MEYTVVADRGTIEYNSADRPPTLYNLDGTSQLLPLPAKDGYEAEVEYFVECCRNALERLPKARLVFTAHSIPLAMARTSRYEEQLKEACRLVACQLGIQDWRLVYQSRSGSPLQPWLEPDILDHLKQLGPGAEGVLAPIGFLSDHMEVIYDLDTEARGLCEQLGIRMVRAATVGVHPRFVSMIRELVLERTEGAPRLAIGEHGPSPDVCPPDCCKPLARL